MLQVKLALHVRKQQVRDEEDLRRGKGQRHAEIKVGVGRRRVDPQVPDDGAEGAGDEEEAGHDKVVRHEAVHVLPHGQQGQVEGDVADARVAAENGVERNQQRGHEEWLAPKLERQRD